MKWHLAVLMVAYGVAVAHGGPKSDEDNSKSSEDNTGTCMRGSSIAGGATQYVSCINENTYVNCAGLKFPDKVISVGGKCPPKSQCAVAVACPAGEVCYGGNVGTNSPCGRKPSMCVQAGAFGLPGSCTAFYTCKNDRDGFKVSYWACEPGFEFNMLTRACTPTFMAGCSVPLPMTSPEPTSSVTSNPNTASPEPTNPDPTISATASSELLSPTTVSPVVTSPSTASPTSSPSLCKCPCGKPRPCDHPSPCDKPCPCDKPSPCGHPSPCGRHSVFPGLPPDIHRQLTCEFLGCY